MNCSSLWLKDAEASEPNDPNACALATSTPDGVPSVRMVLLKGYDSAGFRIFTNGDSRKGHELQANPRAALCLHWKSLRRQVRIEGKVTELPGEAVDEYFHSRSRGSQIAAAVSKQSHELASRAELEASVAAFTQNHEGGDIPRPEFWKGYLLHPTAVEFWSDGANRLHDRLLYERRGDHWERKILYP